jgi:hypothetical protein
LEYLENESRKPSPIYLYSLRQELLRADSDSR